jgi:Ankyrin repeats (many copies)
MMMLLLLFWNALLGHLEVVKWLHENRDEGCTGNAMWWAAKGGHLHVLQWLAENRREGMRPNSNSIDWAASNG